MGQFLGIFGDLRRASCGGTCGQKATPITPARQACPGLPAPGPRAMPLPLLPAAAAPRAAPGASAGPPAGTPGLAPGGVPKGHAYLRVDRLPIGLAHRLVGD